MTYIFHAVPYILHGMSIVRVKENWAWKPNYTYIHQDLRHDPLRVEVAEKLLARGVKPELLPSHQFVGNVSADEQLDRFYEAYRKSLAHLYQ